MVNRNTHTHTHTQKTLQHFPSNATEDVIDLPKLKLFHFGENIDFLANEKGNACSLSFFKLHSTES